MDKLISRCECHAPGFCQRLRRPMPDRLFELCQSDERYRQLFVSRTIHREPGVRNHPTQSKATETARLPSVHQRQGDPVRTWAVGMTTAPRRTPTIERSLASLSEAGWNDVRLFAEPGSHIPNRFTHLPVTWRESRLGPWPNYFLALHELLLRNPSADAFLLAQDDVLFAPGDHQQSLRQYLQTQLWPDSRTGAVSLYTSAAYATNRKGWHKLNRRWIWGALAFVYSRDALVDFLSNSAVRWRLEGKAGGLRNIDVVVGNWQVQRNRTIWFCSPSLAQHIGETSTIWPNARATGKRRARDFLGDLQVPADGGCQPCLRGARSRRPPRPTQPAQTE